MTVNGVDLSASFDGATDRELCVTFVREPSAPILVPGHVVVMDDLAPYEPPEATRLIETAGTRAFRLPAYSPDLNPIGLAVPKIKTVLRRLPPGNIDGLFEGIAEALDSISPTDALHYIAHCGPATMTCKSLQPVRAARKR